MTLLFSDAPGYEDAGVRMSMATAPHGTRIVHLGRYKLPLLPDESGPKAGGDWVPGGVMSATNLAGAIVESRMLGIWERERSQIGLALRPDLVERMTFLINSNRFVKELPAEPGKHAFDFGKLNESAQGRAIKAELDLIHKEAKQSAGGNLAAQRGTNRHDAWEARGATSQLFGTPEVNEQIVALEDLLKQKGLERVPGLSERTVRNVGLRAAGRFDDVLRTTRDVLGMPAGTLLMSDLKTKRREFYSLLEVRIQLAVYATAEWMLYPRYVPDASVADVTYVPGPAHHVSQGWGVILWAPSDGAAPKLLRANLRKGRRDAELARAVCDARSEGKSVGSKLEAEWPDT